MKKRLHNHVNNTEPLDRVDGRLKVTGAARYSADYTLPGLTYAVLVSSTIAKGQIKSIDTKNATSAPGVIDIISHLNAPVIPGYQATAATGKAPATSRPLWVFHDQFIYFSGQAIALVIADTYERALYAASLVKTEYLIEEHQTDLEANIQRAVTPKNWTDYSRGEADAYKKAPVVVEQQYVHPVEVHNPMEMHCTIAHWEAIDKVTVYDKTQGVKGAQRTIMDAFKLPEENVQVNTLFMGGGFGSGLRTWPHVIATVLAAKKVNRPVKLVLNREQMFTMVGYRPRSIQKIGIGATTEGKITGITHEATAITSSYEEFTDRTVNMSKYMYTSPNVTTRYRIVPMNLSTPTWMRGPGESTGSFALECAMDELSYALKLDPLELRLRNYAETDQEKNLPWSSKHLRECYKIGSERVGWNKRNPVPASMRDGEMLVGYGMGSGVFNASRNRALVMARIYANGSLLLQSAVSDGGPGTATTMVQIASEIMGVSADRIKFELGNSSYPMGPTQGGSTTTSTLGSAVHDACVALKRKLLELCTEPALKTAAPEDLLFKDGSVSLATRPSVNILYADILKQQSLPQVEVTEESKSGDERLRYSMYSFSVHFTIIHVHPFTGVVKVKRVVSVTDAGRIISLKTAESQVIGGVVGGIGMTLMEEAVIDQRYGRYVNNNFADYHIPVHADMPHIEPIFINKKDPYINPMGTKGLGEISMVGFAPALVNAIYHATGKRIRELPVTPDKLL